MIFFYPYRLTLMYLFFIIVYIMILSILFAIFYLYRLILSILFATFYLYRLILSILFAIYTLKYPKNAFLGVNWPEKQYYFLFYIQIVFYYQFYLLLWYIIRY
jgi:hypothetical protein